MFDQNKTDEVLATEHFSTESPVVQALLGGDPQSQIIASMVVATELRRLQRIMLRVVKELEKQNERAASFRTFIP